MRRLAHGVFLKVLAARAGDEDCVVWRETLAGLLVLRLLDRRLSSNAGITSTDDSSAAATRASVLQEEERIAERVLDTLESDGRTKCALLELFRATISAPLTDVPPVLLAYGDQLADRNQLILAADVYKTVRHLCRCKLSTGTSVKRTQAVATARYAQVRISSRLPRSQPN